MTLLDAFVPPSLFYCARRLSSLCLMLAVLVAFFFPSAAPSGTETDVDRWLTTGLLVAGGLALRFGARRPLALPATLVLLAAAGAAIGAPWVAVFAAGALVYSALSGLRSRLRRAAAEPDATDGADGEPPAEPEHTRAEIVRENVEAVTMALVLALTVREFAFEAFQIPTGSMEPTILGVDLPERDWGDRLLASKVQLLDGDPPRWSIVVFRYPLSRNVNYIKRLVGLPGEHVEIKRGDIYVDGECAAKPEIVQESLWFPVFPEPERPYAPAERSIAEAFVADDGNAEWTLSEDEARVSVAAETESWLRLDQGPGETDLRVSVTADVEGMSDGGTLLLRVQGARRRVQLEVAKYHTRLTAPGLEWNDPDGAVGTLARGTNRIGLGVADRVVRIYVNGRVVARMPHADETNQDAGVADMGAVAVGVSAATVRISEVSIDHDLQYSEGHSWNVPDDGFVMLGDNTYSSRDSRYWRAHVVTLKNGREYIVEDQQLAEDGRRYANYRHADGVHTFLDDWGIARSFPDEEVAGVAKFQKRPFARRSDLIGRAFLIFYPWPPFGEWRPRILP